MITQEKMENIYETIIKNSNLSIKNLMEFSFTEVDISYLEENNIIKKDYNKGEYIFTSANRLYKYGNYLATTDQFDKALKCFDLSISLAPNNRRLRYKIFESSLMCNNYKKSFSYYIPIYDNERADNRFILYLLNLITDIDSPYKEVYDFRMKDLEEVEIDEFTKKTNLIRRYAFFHQFHNALELMFEKDKKKFTVNERVLINLFKNAQVECVKRKKVVTKLLKDKEYKAANYYLTQLKEKNRSNSVLRKFLYLTETFIDIKENGTIPELKSSNTKSLFNAIDNNDFNKALKKAKEYSSKGNDSNNNMFVPIITDINKEIELNKNNNYDKENVLIKKRN